MSSNARIHKLSLKVQASFLSPHVIDQFNICCNISQHKKIVRCAPLELES